MTEKRWRKSEVNEALVVLYLRLNGYFTTGLIVQAPEWGQARTEIDCLAVRHPQHSQPEREVPSSPFLGLQEGIVDLLICEVKSLPAEVAFNRRLREEPGVLEAVLRWGGLFDDAAVPGVARQLLPFLQSGVSADRARGGVSEGGIRVRGLLCCPPATEGELPGLWCLVRSEILRFAHECFNPAVPRNACSTRYNFQLWGGGLAPVVEYFKGLTATDTPRIKDIYEYVDAA